VVCFTGDGFYQTMISHVGHGPSAAICDSVLRVPQKSNMAIQAKLSLIYGKDALCQRTVDTWAARFQSGKTLVEDDE
jgi:hypothetical protein